MKLVGLTLGAYVRTQGERKSKSVGYIVREVAWILFILCMRWMGRGKIPKICMYRPHRPLIPQIGKLCQTSLPGPCDVLYFFFYVSLKCDKYVLNHTPSYTLMLEPIQLIGQNRSASSYCSGAS